MIFIFLFFAIVIMIGIMVIIKVKTKQKQQVKYGVIDNPIQLNPNYHPIALNRLSNYKASIDHLIYQNPYNPNYNQYIYHYVNSKRQMTTQTIFPKPATKTLKVTKWQKQIWAVDVAMEMYDPNYDPEKLKQDPEMFQTVFQKYLQAYVQSFSNYQDYKIDIAIQMSPATNIDLGVNDYVATLTFDKLPESGEQHE